MHTEADTSADLTGLAKLQATLAPLQAEHDALAAKLAPLKARRDELAAKAELAARLADERRWIREQYVRDPRGFIDYLAGFPARRPSDRAIRPRRSCEGRRRPGARRVVRKANAPPGDSDEHEPALGRLVGRGAAP